MKRTWILAAVVLLLGAASPARAQLATVFLDNGFEGDTPGTNPNAPTIGSWAKPAQTTIGATVITNDVTAGPSSGTNPPFSGTNYLRIQRTDGGQNSARIEAYFGSILPGNTITATFAYLYESTGSSCSAIRLM